MIQDVQGAFVVVGLNTLNPTYFWNGVKLPGVISFNASVDAGDDNNSIKLRVNDINSLYTEMRLANITVKKV